MLRYVALAIMALAGLALPATLHAQAPTNGGPWGPIDRIVTELPEGPLYWRLQTFASRAAAEAAAGTTGQVGEAEGQVWLFTLGRSGEAPAGGALVAEIGPLEVPSAAEYRLEILYSIQPSGGVSALAQGAAVHLHPGPESWYLLAGEQTVWTPWDVQVTEAGGSYTVPAGDTSMIVINTGRGERRALAFGVGDAARPWVTPSVFP